MTVAPFMRASYRGNANRGMMPHRWRGALVVFCMVLLLPSVIATQRIVQERQRDPIPATNPQQARIAESYGKLPLSFEENHGQTDPAVRFLAHGQGYSLFLAPTEVVLSLTPATPYHSNDATLPLRQDELATDGVAPRASALRFSFLGANPSPVITDEDALPGTVNYFIRNDPAQWRTNIGTAAKVRYHDLYPGIDLLLYGTQGGQWEYDVIVAPGVDSSRFAFMVSGTDGMAINDEGDLVLRTPSREVRQHAPALYQDVNGVQQRIDGSYEMRQDGTVGFHVGAYNHHLPLVIDPTTLTYSTYLGGSGHDVGYGIAVDGAGNTYITGYAYENFPTTPGAYQPGPGGDYLFDDAFVTKLNATGTALVYSTYLGGKYNDVSYGIAIDSAGNAYVTGTASDAFPTTPGAYMPTAGGGSFVTKVSSTGTTLVYSTYLGHGADDSFGIAVDGAGNAYVIGYTGGGFLTTPGAYQTAFGGYYDAFVTKLNAAGTALVYSTYLGGSNLEQGSGIAVDGAGNTYVTGYTKGNFPTTPGAYQTVIGGYGDAVFVTKLNATGTALVYSTYLGRAVSAYGNGIAVDGAGNAYVTGTTGDGFPTTPGAYQTAFGNIENAFLTDAFVTKVNPTGTALVYSTYLGGNGGDNGNAIAVDGAGNAYVTGSTSGNFPTTPGAYQTAISSGSAFVTKLNATGTALAYSTYLGGNKIGEADYGNGIAVDGAGNAYVTGRTGGGFPTTPGSYQATLGGIEDAFVTKMGIPPSPPTVASVSPNSGPQGGGTRVTIMGTGFLSGATVTVGSVAATSVNVSGNGVSLTATTPVHAAGAVNIVVTNPDGQSASLTNAYTYVSPTPPSRPAPPPTVTATAAPVPTAAPSPQPLLVFVPGIAAPWEGCNTAEYWSNANFGPIYQSLTTSDPRYFGTRYNFNWRRDNAAIRPFHKCTVDGEYGPQDTYAELHDAAWRLNDQIQTQLNTIHPRPNEVHIITHSMGGALSLTYIHDYPPQTPTRIVLLDSPIKGCAVLNFCHWAGAFDFVGYDTTAFDQLTQPAFVRDMEDAFATLTNLRTYAIATNGDQIIYYPAQWPIADATWPAGLHPDPNDPYLSSERDGNGNPRAVTMTDCRGQALCHTAVLSNPVAEYWIRQILIYHPAPLPIGRGGPPGGAQAPSGPTGQGGAPTPTAKPPTVSTPAPTPVPAPPHR